ncbi:MAG: alkane 1-monooxygenase [Bacteroidota bacterium]
MDDWKDLKYLAALTIPIAAIISIYVKGSLSYFTPFYAFFIIPILELLLPTDNGNLNKQEHTRKKKNFLFDWMLYLNIPIIFGLAIYTFWEVHNSILSLSELIGLLLSLGIVFGVNGINVAHELGHRQQSAERYLGKLLLMPSLYMHFYIEHNFGHHAHAATKEDPATARFNQSLYSFWLTSMTRQYRNAWNIQNKIRSKDRMGFLSPKNDMLYYLLFQTLYLLAIFFLFGTMVLWFAIASAIVGILLLETVNYIEHYGLLRKKLPSGRYERVRECHSWNSNHIIGRIVLYELTRHSDHHYKSSKKYQLLDCHDISPQMPFGYPTSMVLSFVPPLWFYIMNRRIPKEMQPNADSLSMA